MRNNQTLSSLRMHLRMRLDPILDYINSQHHQEEDMYNAWQAYNVMASPTQRIHPSSSAT